MSEDPMDHTMEKWVCPGSRDPSPNDGLIQINNGDKEMGVGCKIDSNNRGRQPIISLSNYS